MKALIKALRAAESSYQNTVPRSPYIPANLVALFLTVICVAQPEIGLVFLFGYLLSRATANKQWNVRNMLIENYQYALSKPSEVKDEIVIDQSLFLSTPDPIGATLELTTTHLMPPQVHFFRFIFDPDGQYLTSILKKTDNFFRQRRTDPLVKFDKDGVCYGLMMTWYAAIFVNQEQEFFADLKEMARQPQTVTARQEKFIQAITHAQQNQHVSLVLKLPITGSDIKDEEIFVSIKEKSNISFVIKDDKNLDTNLRFIAQQTVAKAQQNIKRLIKISVRKPNTGHAIGGALVHSVGDDLALSTFDANYRCTKFLLKDINSATEYLVNLLKYNYRDFFQNATQANIALVTYYASIEPRNQLTVARLNTASYNPSFYCHIPTTQMDRPSLNIELNNGIDVKHADDDSKQLVVYSGPG